MDDESPDDRQTVAGLVEQIAEDGGVDTLGHSLSLRAKRLWSDDA